MTTTLTIGELAKQSGLPTKTIRFYEDIGLIGKPERLDNGYRTYGESSVQELKLIKNARDIGLPIAEIKKLMIGCDQGDCKHSQSYVDKQVKDYIAVLSQKIVELNSLRSNLQTLRKEWAKNGAGKYCCNVLGQIAHISKGGE